MQSSWSWFALVCCLLLLFRSTLLELDKSGAIVTDGDAAGHVGFVQEYYNSRERPISLADRFLLHGSDYPTGFHRLISFLRLRPNQLFRYGRFLPLVFDGWLLLVTITSVVAFGGANFEWLIFFPFLRMFWGNAGRSSHFNERAFGVLFGNVFVLSAVVYHILGMYQFIIVAIMAYTIISVSSKFAIQAVWIFSVALTVMTWNFVFMGILLLSFTFSAVVSRGHSLSVLRGLVRHSRWQRQMRREGKLLNQDWWSQITTVRFTKKYLYHLGHNSILRPFTDNPLTLPVAAIATMPTVDQRWSWPALIGVAVCIAVSTRPLEFIGEPERYLEFAIVPTFVALSFVPVNELPVLASLAAVATTAVLFPSALERARKRSWREQRGEALDDVAAWLLRQGPVTLVTDPGRTSIYLGLRARNAKFVWIFGNVGVGQAFADFSDLLHQYPHLSERAVPIAQRYGATLLVQETPGGATKAALDVSSLGPPVYTNSRYSIFRI